MSTVAQTATTELTGRHIFKFYWPLALSWLFMGVEGPISVSLIGRLPDSTVYTAAFNLMLGLAMFIESPVIDLLSTSTTLATNRQRYLMIRKFTMWLMVFETVAHALFTITPLYSMVTIDLLKIPPDVAEAARTGMLIMIPWSACIGWRRYHQGILIRHGRTRAVGSGTFVRMTTLGTLSLAMYLIGGLPSVTIAAIALVFSVFAEALFIHIAAKRVIAEHYSHEDPEDPHDLTWKKLFKFHLPLTATTLVMFAGGPLVSSALAQSTNPTASMAAFQICGALLWLLRAVVYALPEAVITLGRVAENRAPIKRFCNQVGFICVGVLLGLWLTGGAYAIFRQVFGAENKLAEMAAYAFALGAALPYIGALSSYCRGMLTLNHLTASRLWAVGIGVSVLFASLHIGVTLQWPGLLNALLSMTLSQLTELGVLYFFWRMSAPRRQMA